MQLIFRYTLLFLFISITGYSQKIIKHTVKSGESIFSIAKKYDIAQNDIYELNPKLKGAVLGLKTVVKIPNKNFKEKQAVSKKEVVVSNKTMSVDTETSSKSNHLVKPKETIYSISKRYSISMETLCDLNPALKTSNLKAGMNLILPDLHTEIVPESIVKQQTEALKVNSIASNVDVVHRVLPKETLYGISKKTGVSIEELSRLNPSTIDSGLKVDQMLIIKKGTIEPIVNETKVIEEQIEVETSKPLSADNMSKAAFLIEKASEHMGTRYRRGGTTSAGFDCSGLMFHTFKTIDLDLPRSSHEMATYGEVVNKSQANKGDLIFFATFGGSRITHVGMITEVLEDEIKFIHSSTSQGVMISSTKENYYSKSFVQINRVLKD